MSDVLKHTVLYDWHRINGAKLVPFAGWEMPLQYRRGPIEEHHLVRRSAGLFDIGHMGRFEVRGAEAGPYLDMLLTNPPSLLGEGRARYALLCREDGGILDDVYVYRLPGRYLVVVNAANREKDFGWFSARTAGAEVQVEDVSDSLTMFALQGPKALDLLAAAVSASPESSGAGGKEFPERFTAFSLSVAGVECTAGRTGYTGEDGVELFTARDDALRVWESLLLTGAERGIEAGPVGLAARDSLRFEPGFSLYGHEISDKVTPVEAGLLWACDLSRPFIGRDAILRREKEGPSEKLAVFEMIDRSVPREGYGITDENGRDAGRVVSGMFSPTTGKFAGNAYLRTDLAKPGNTFYISIRGENKKAAAVKRPLYVPPYRK
jgi:glycine cleavage system T protein